MELHKAKLAAEAASVEVAVAARNEQIRAAIGAGLSLREIEASTGIPRSSVQRIGNAEPLSEAEYLRLANNEAVARAEVVALAVVVDVLAEADAAPETEV